MSGDEIEVRLLSPVTLLVGGEQRLITQSRVLAMLAALALDERLTADHRRFNALLMGAGQGLGRSTLTHYLAKLRREVGADVLPVNQRNGARLHLARDRVDYWRFRAYLDAADGFRDDPERRIAPLRAAVAEWRGDEPLMGIGQAHFDSETRFLDELHRKTYLDLVTAQRKSGRYEAAVADARRASALWPMDHEVLDALMAAGAAAGDAVVVKNAARDFAVRLGAAGLRPPPDLRRKADEFAELAATASPVEVAGFVPPNHLPRALEVLHGREAELTRLDWLVEGGRTRSRAAALVGAPGVGKTQLALTWAHGAASRFPDGVLHGDLDGFADRPPASVERILTSFVTALGGTPGGDLLARYRSLLANRSVLVVLDNAESYEQVDSLLPAGPRCAAVVTSRSRMPGFGSAGSAEEVVIEPLTPEAGLAMLRGLIRDDRVKREWLHAEQLVEACEGLPLAIAIVAARATRRSKLSLARILDELRTTALLDSSVPTNRHITLRDVLRWSYAALSAPASRLFLVLGLHPGPTAGPDALGFASGLPEDELRRAVEELLAGNLLEEVDEDRFRLHDVLRAFAIDLATTSFTESERADVRARVADHLMWAGRACDLALGSGREYPAGEPPTGLCLPEADQDRAMRWFDDEYAVIVAVLTAPAYRDLESRHWQLALAVTRYQQMRGHWLDWESFLVAARDTAARTTGPRFRSAVHRSLGTARRKLHKYDLAASDARAALALAREAGDELAEAHCQQVLGAVKESQEDWAAATEAYTTALTTYQRLEDHRGVAYTATGLANALGATGQPGPAADMVLLASSAGERGVDGYGRAAIHRHLALRHLRAGDPAEAVRRAADAIEEYQRVGAAVNEAHVQALLADAHDELGEDAEARLARRRVVELLEGAAALGGDDRRLLDETRSRNG
ncbi:ATP-binding protein [Saccharothrix obliqua]|uniref:ATP-binding protein n=1 Tax=Saccharothrix obliqua TaxID=2861747 RepID=UPI001C5DC660|nr:NB-ARC domain-containing protein [Saccharothrix obliqua]MBW4720340.1 AAA family ATPase [Saccharothrix obliqua]